MPQINRSRQPPQSQSDPMRILHVIAGLDPALGGPVSAMEGLAVALKNLGVEATILTAYRRTDDPTFAVNLENQGIPVQRVGPVRTPLQTHPSIKPVVQQAVQRADAVHIHGLWEDIQHQAARASLRLGKPYVIRPCGMLDPWSLGQSAMRKRLYLAWRLRKNLNHAAAIHFTAAAERDLTAPLKIQAPAIVEPNGLNLQKFSGRPDGLFRQQYPQLGDKPYVLFLSRIHRKKGLDILIPAFAQAAPQDVSLVIAGPGKPDYVEEIRALAQSHGLADRVVMPGLIAGDMKLSAYTDAEVFALPSYQENFGNVVIESLACGTPVLISDQVNIYREVVEAQVGGASPANIVSFTQLMSHWLANGRIRDQAHSRMQAFVSQHYDWREIAGRWLDHYAELIGQDH